MFASRGWISLSTNALTLTEYVSAFVDRELQPLLANIRSYIKDTTDFLNKLSRFNNLPDNTIFNATLGERTFSFASSSV